MKSIELTIHSLTAERALDKLKRGGVAVISAVSPRKNVLIVRIDGKDRKKVFAILESSCYNIENERAVGGLRAVRKLASLSGLLIGVLFFLILVPFFQTRVLGVEVVGSGAYYEREVRSALKGHGVKPLAALPKEYGGLTAELLSLPRVEFVAFSHRSGILTVEVNVAESDEALSPTPLFAPASGIVEELVAVRGTPLFAVGDSVKMGDVVVADKAYINETEISVIVIAKVAVRYSFSREYEGDEAAARAQAFLDFGETAEIHTTKTARGWRVEGTAVAVASRNLA